MRPIVWIASVILLASISFAACEGSSSIFVPAVVGDGGSIVQIDLQLVPGHGDIYLTTSPHTAVSTQVSAEDSIHYGFLAAGRDIRSCDVLVRIGGDHVASYVEGPSAGAAFSVLSYSALTGRPILAGSTITGAMTAQGQIEPVGGVYEKVRAAAQHGFRYFVMPIATIQDHILLLPLKRAYPIQLLEVRDGAEAIDVLVNGARPETPNISAPLGPIPNGIEAYASHGIDIFRPLAQGMIDRHAAVVAQLNGGDRETQSLKGYFQNELEREKVLLGKGYLFTAANEAFLDYIGASTILNADRMNSINLSDRKSQISQCLAQLPHPSKTGADWEWLTGADLREAWAEYRLSSTATDSATLVEEKYYLFNQLQYADGWCFISGQLHQLAPAGGPDFDEPRLRSLAAEKLDQIDVLNSSSSETKDHAATAHLSFEQGRYAASLFDSTYVISVGKAEHDIVTLSGDDFQKRFNDLLQGNRTSLWGRIYQSQGIFLASSGDAAQKPVAYQVLLYAENLDALADQIAAVHRSSISPASVPSPYSPSPYPFQPIYPWGPSPSPASGNPCAASYIMAFLFSTVVIAWIRK